MNIANELLEARILLEKGSGYEFPAPFLFRVFGKKKIKIQVHEPTAFVYLEMLRMRLEIGVTDKELERMSIEDGMRLVQFHGQKITQMIAFALLRTKLKNRLFNRYVAKKLLKTFSFTTLLELMQLITLGGGLEAFMNIIGLSKAVRLTKPNHPSHETEES